MVEVIKKRHQNHANYSWNHDFLLEMGRFQMNEVTLCPTCYDNRSGIPLGAKTHDYRHQWETLRKYHFNIKGKTVNSYYECSQCGFQRITKDTYVDGFKRNTVPVMRQNLLDWVRYYWNDYKKWKNLGSYTHENIGRIKAYKEMYDLIKLRGMRDESTD